MDLITALNRGIVETELNCLSSGIYDSLHIIKFDIQNSIDFSEDDALKVQNMFKSIYSLAEYNMFLNLYNNYLIFFKDKTLIDCQSIASKIRHEITDCKLSSCSLYAEVEVSEVKKSETLSNLVKNLIKNREQSKEEIAGADILQVLKDVFLNQDKIIGIQNFYKGVSLYRDVRILNITKENILIFKTSPARAMILKSDTFTYIRHKDFNKVVKAQILNVDVKTGTIYIDKLEYMSSSAVDRKFIRVEPKNKIKAKIFVNKKDYAVAEISNISVKSIALKIKEFNKRDFAQGDVKIKFMIPDMNLQKVNSIVIDMEYFSSDSDKVIFLLHLNKFNRVRILEYIGARQKELIEELRVTLS